MRDRSPAYSGINSAKIEARSETKCSEDSAIAEGTKCSVDSEISKRSEDSAKRKELKR
jgi:hypothetical protein